MKTLTCNDFIPSFFTLNFFMLAGIYIQLSIISFKTKLLDIVLLFTLKFKDLLIIIF